MMSQAQQSSAAKNSLLVILKVPVRVCTGVHVPVEHDAVFRQGGGRRQDVKGPHRKLVPDRAEGDDVSGGDRRDYGDRECTDRDGKQKEFFHGKVSWEVS